MKRPCLDCGTLAESSRCPEHTTDHRTVIERDRVRLSPRERGYDAQWTRLSKRARAIQPWCDVCGSVEDLTTDHTPQAWERKAAGLSIRLEDVRVLCRSHNASAGTSRPGSERAHASR